MGKNEKKKAQKPPHAVLNVKAFRLSIMLIFIPMIQMAMTMVIRVGRRSDPAEIYLRNLSSIFALILLGIFFRKYYIIHVNGNFKKKTMKPFKIITLLSGIASIVKAAISLFFTIKYLIVLNLTGLYYLGEMIVWTAVAFFFFAYFKRISS